MDGIDKVGSLVGRDEPREFGVVVAGFEVVESRLLVVEISLEQEVADLGDEEPLRGIDGLYGRLPSKASLHSSSMLSFLDLRRPLKAAS